MNGGYQVSQGTVDAVSRELHDSAKSLTSAGEPPLPIEAGRVSGVLAALGAHLASETETLAGQLGGTAEKVTTAGATFAKVDQEAASTVTPQEVDVEAPSPPVPPGTVQGPTHTY